MKCKEQKSLGVILRLPNLLLFVCVRAYFFTEIIFKFNDSHKSLEERKPCKIISKHTHIYAKYSFSSLAKMPTLEMVIPMRRSWGEKNTHTHIQTVSKKRSKRNRQHQQHQNRIWVNDRSKWWIPYLSESYRSTYRRHASESMNLMSLHMLCMHSMCVCVILSFAYINRLEDLNKISKRSLFRI